ncbi:ISMsm1, transposase orfA [Mycolicibacterium mageritense DSM 44476 = CIP 104973]|nr:ISMsm1, transposase orfA [Mycolicibacterium mageritense DSM 44476 = CIP 104973]
MAAPRKFDPETRERAVRMYHDRIAQTGDSKLAARKQVGQLLGINQDTLRGWVENRYGTMDSTTSAAPDEKDAELKSLRKEVAELRRANEILKTATAFFAAAEVDRRIRWSSSTSTLTATGSGSTRSAPCSPSTACRSPRPPTTRALCPGSGQRCRLGGGARGQRRASAVCGQPAALRGPQDVACDETRRSRHGPRSGGPVDADLLRSRGSCAAHGAP